MADLPYATCPYNKNHRILVMRMPGHIIKCEKNYVGPPLKICKYNATHRVLDMEKHLVECQDYIKWHRFEKTLKALQYREPRTNDLSHKD